MTFADRGSLSGDTLYAARGVWRLIRNDIRWSDDFELSGLGLIRSFFAQVVRLPFVVVFVLLVSRSTGASTSWPFVALACTFDLLGAMAYLLVAMITIRLLRLPGALGFVILNNWADLVFAIAAGVLCGMAHFVDPSLVRHCCAAGDLLCVARGAGGSGRGHLGRRIACCAQCRDRRRRRSTVRCRLDRIDHVRQIKTVRRRDGPASTPILGLESVGDILRGPATGADLGQRADHRAHLPVQERPRCEVEAYLPINADDVQFIQRLHGALRLTGQITKGREVVRADEMPGGVMHWGDIEGRLHPENPLSFDGRGRLAVKDSIEVATTPRRKPRVKIVGNHACGKHRDRMRNKVGVQGVANHVRPPVLLQIRVYDLQQRVHARICSARSMDPQLFAAELEDRCLNGALNGRHAVFLGLKSLERRAVVLDVEAIARHQSR